MLSNQYPAFVYSALLLLIRLVVGLTFFVSSRKKFKNIKKFARENSVSVPVGYFVATAEFAGALGLVFGVLPQLAALGLMLLMISTMSLHIFKWHSPYWASRGGWEYDLMLFALCGVIVLFGAGAYSTM